MLTTGNHYTNHMLNLAYRITGLILACTLLIACTGRLVLGTVYNGASGRMATQIKSYATFSESQQAIIDNNFASYHSWHRSTQLPAYSRFLNDIIGDLEHTRTTSLSTVTIWQKQINNFSAAMRRCNPLNNAAEFLKTLNDKQVQEIANSFDKISKKHARDHSTESTEQRQQRRQKSISKWIKRAGLKINDQQKKLIDEKISQQINLGSQRMYLRKKWTDQFIELLQKRDQPDFDTRIGSHIKSLSNMTRENYPAEWRSNADLWASFTQEFLSLQSTEQREVLVKKLRKFSTTVKLLSEKKKGTAVEMLCFDSGVK